jgi:prepilin-type processing-associated H-X9-DG protein
LRADAVAELPPPGLIVKTLAFVAEHACKDLPSAPTHKPSPAPVETTIGRLTYDRPWWRRVDVLVAASIAVTVVGLLLPGLLHLRVLGMQTQCENNLRELWRGLNAYQTQHQALPDIASAPRPVAGMVIPILRDAGVLSSQLVACCPGAADGAACLNVSVHELANMPGRDFERAAPKLLPGYAYSLGFRDDAGRLHGPAASLPDVPAAQMPILADAPGTPVSFGNSANHSGRGQNVLFADGHVSFATRRTAGLKEGDDIYLNQANKVAAGLGSHDVVLGTGAATP